MNVATFLTKAAAAYPDRTALRSSRGRLSYAELDAAAAAFARFLRDRGIAPGDRVAVYMRNCDEYAIAMLGVFRAGLALVPVNARLQVTELEFILADSGAVALVLGADEAATVAALARRPELLVGVGCDAGTPFEATLEEGRAGLPDADVDSDALAWLFYTSGTTGRPKGAMLSHRNLERMALNCLADVCGFQPEDVVLHAAPLSHGSGLYLLPALARGAENLLLDRPSFDATELLTTVERERVTAIAFLAPTMIVMLLHSPVEVDTSSLRCVIYGGAPIHAAHVRAAIERFGPVFVQIYGQGEAPMTISYLRAADHADAESDGVVAAGIPRTDVDVRLVDDEGADVRPGELGEVVVRGDVVMRGYWNDEAATARALRGGWLHTGDIGRCDDRGRLYLLDRRGDVIISGGSNIYPREVEEVLVLHPGVREAAVFGVPDELWGESVVAAVVPAEGAAPGAEELIAFCRERIASYKKPRYVEFVDALPKNAYGKVLRRELASTEAARAVAAAAAPTGERDAAR